MSLDLNFATYKNKQYQLKNRVIRKEDELVFHLTTVDKTKITPDFAMDGEKAILEINANNADITDICMVKVRFQHKGFSYHNGTIQSISIQPNWPTLIVVDRRPDPHGIDSFAIPVEDIDYFEVSKVYTRKNGETSERLENLTMNPTEFVEFVVSIQNM